MTFKEWLIKNFSKDKAVIVYFVKEDARIKKHWCIPNSDGTVSLPSINASIVITKETRYLTTKHNIPTYVAHYENCESMDLTNLNERYLTAEQLDLIIENEELAKAYRASQKHSLSNEGMFILIALAVGFLGMFYFFNTKFKELDNKLPDPTPIVETIENDNTINTGE